MDIRLLSDIHLEFGGADHLDFGSGDILILAGDVLCARHLSGTNPEASPYGSKYLQFFDTVSKNYNRVLMVMGNHEHYSSTVDKDAEVIKRHLPSNITLLDNESVEIDGWTFVGGTLWTDMNKNDPITMNVVANGMNDFRICRIDGGQSKFQPHHAATLHARTLRAIDSAVKNAPDNVFVITHHAPHDNSVHEMYKGEVHMNGGYRSDLSNFILDRPQIKYWVHGHMHNSSDYNIGECRVMANPRGYPIGNGYENKGHDPKWNLTI